MIYGYIRVSSDKQTTENQRFEIANYTKAKELPIDEWIEETISDCPDLWRTQTYSSGICERTPVS